ncbi:GAG-pre-integrase domain-containing protein, partial [Solirubrobacter sp. CPCC 204708]|nr:GAG-pre-integrase domain-containing protein [Solirubrobacter deserti]
TKDQVIMVNEIQFFNLLLIFVDITMVILNQISENENDYCLTEPSNNKRLIELGSVPNSGYYLSLSDASSWVLDTGASSHICNNIKELRGSRRLGQDQVSLRVGNGASVAALAVGTCDLNLPSGHVMKLENCLFMPGIVRNIISVSTLTCSGYEFVFNRYSCTISIGNKSVGSGIYLNGLYFLNMDGSVNCLEDRHDAKRHKRPQDEKDSTYVWHLRLGHISEERINKLGKDGQLGSYALVPLPTCEPCLMGKMTKSPFTGHSERAGDILGLIHSDVCGPLNKVARGGFTYFITFTDDHSRLGTVYLMKHKSESFEKFKEYRAEVEK